MRVGVPKNTPASELAQQTNIYSEMHVTCNRSRAAYDGRMHSLKGFSDFFLFFLLHSLSPSFFLSYSLSFSFSPSVCLSFRFFQLWLLGLFVRAELKIVLLPQ